MAQTQKVSTCLWFDTEAEDAVNFYVSIFEDSHVVRMSRYGKDQRMPAGTVLTVEFDLAGTRFMALNGGPLFKFTEASSMVVKCDTQAEIDRVWEALLADGGCEVQCGWLKDKYGLSWQIVPVELGDMMQDPDGEKTARVMAALLQMVKLDVAKLTAAFKGEPDSTPERVPARAEGQR